MTLKQFREILVRRGVVMDCAIDDGEECDGGMTLYRTGQAYYDIMVLLHDEAPKPCRHLVTVDGVTAWCALDDGHEGECVMRKGEGGEDESK